MSNRIRRPRGVYLFAPSPPLAVHSGRGRIDWAGFLPPGPPLYDSPDPDVPTNLASQPRVGGAGPAGRSARTASSTLGTRGIRRGAAPTCHPRRTCGTSCAWRARRRRRTCRTHRTRRTHRTCRTW